MMMTRRESRAQGEWTDGPTNKESAAPFFPVVYNYFNRLRTRARLCLCAFALLARCSWPGNVVPALGKVFFRFILFDSALARVFHRERGQGERELDHHEKGAAGRNTVEECAGQSRAGRTEVASASRCSSRRGGCVKGPWVRVRVRV